jgi:hypothetical protein
MPAKKILVISDLKGVPDAPKLEVAAAARFKPHVIV